MPSHSFVRFAQGDTLSRTDLTAAFAEHGPFEHVLHFAALKAVGESVSQPLKYYSNNLTGTLVLLEVMQEHDCTSIGALPDVRLDTCR